MSTLFEEHLERAIAIGTNNIHGEDHLVIAALDRALANIDGMLAMVDRKNMFCGMPIVRFQLDTAMTLFGRQLVADVDDYVRHMMEGKERRKYLNRKGKQMTDSYLHKKLTVTHEHTSDLYWEASGFVHFSTHHLRRVLDLDLYKRTREVQFRSRDLSVAGWPDLEIRGALVQFVFASTIILDECEIWEKKRFPSEGSV